MTRIIYLAAMLVEGAVLLVQIRGSIIEMLEQGQQEYLLLGAIHMHPVMLVGMILKHATRVLATSVLLMSPISLPLHYTSKLQTGTT